VWWEIKVITRHAGVSDMNQTVFYLAQFFEIRQYLHYLKWHAVKISLADSV
jgi:hypothetical protein